MKQSFNTWMVIVIPRLKFLLVVATLVFLAGCDDDEAPAPASPKEINLSDNDALGSVLVDGNGSTLYFFAKDTKGTSTCEGGCLNTWPILYIENPKPGAGLSSSDFDEITRADGQKQTTYKSWPLYHYSPAGDGKIEAAGATGGENVNSVWFVAKPDYSIMFATAQLVGADNKNYTSSYTEGTGETQYFVDGNGRTIYIFTKDYTNTNTFTASDLSNNGVWPIFYKDLQSIPSTLNANDFGMITVYGQEQLTYKGWPLYYYGDDAQRGDNKGVSFPSPGVWPVVNGSTQQAGEYTGPTIKLVEDDLFGPILTDQDSRTLYFFTKDINSQNNCTGGCASIWPVFYSAQIRLDASSGLNSSDFGVITTSEGEMQTTYKGWPLYYYSPDGNGVLESPGETLGDGFNNVWYVAKNDYSLMVADAQLVGHDGINYTSSYVAGDGSTKYFTDEYGRTLYMFTKDYKNDNNFTATDLSNNSVWPVFHVEIADLPSYINKDEFGEITLADGNTRQTTFRGWPLYYFGQDAMTRGSNKGVSFPSPGVWPIVNNSTTTATDAPTVITTDDDVFGTIITDATGRSLYFFTRDSDGTNHCTGGCTSIWPVFHVEAVTLKSGSVLSVSDFEEITLSDGVTKQTTYKGWPLYYYSPTANSVIEPAGDVGGDGVNNVWRVAKESYDLMYVDAQLIGHDGVNYIYSGGAITTGTGITKYFSDAYGRSIYTFKNDTKDDNNFTASDFSNDSVWPIFHVTIDELPSGMDKSEFDEIDVFGRKQLTFRGWPLYYFGQDQMIRGNNKGISYPSPGVWPIAKDDLAAAQ